METSLIDGRDIASAVQQELRGSISACERARSAPGLAVILVGENPASVSYVTAKERDCEKIGIESFDIRLPDSISEDELLRRVDECNRDERVDGILVQLPLPPHIDSARVIEAIRPDKDVDGFHPISLGRLVAGLPTFEPCTPAGVVEMLMRSGHDPGGQHVVVVGRSNIVGRPLSILLGQKRSGGNATVTLCHSRTRDIDAVVRSADIVIAAIGVPRFVTPEMVRPGAVVIDVGVNRVEDTSRTRGYRLVGDADFDRLMGHVSAITPVPGGVGPMTRTMLLANTVRAAERHAGLSEGG